MKNNTKANTHAQMSSYRVSKHGNVSVSLSSVAKALSNREANKQRVREENRILDLIGVRQ